MKKQELLNMIDESLLDKLYGYCYPRTRDSYAAQELCSDIVYALIKAANRDGEIAEPYAFIWRVARNVYADYCQKRNQESAHGYVGDPDDALAGVATDEEDAGDALMQLLPDVYRRIAYLTRAYREVMIAFYLDGKPIAQIAKEQGVREDTVRQRLYSARKKLKEEVENMTTTNKPVALGNIDYDIIGTGDPGWGDPREGFERQLSMHVLHLCHRSPKTASEIAAELNVPTLYIEQELEILTRGRNGQYGLLRRLDNSRYGVNFVLFDRETMEKAIALYEQQIPMVADVIANFIEQHKDEYLAFPYLNHEVDLNLILWQQIFRIAHTLEDRVTNVLNTKYFADVVDPEPNRPFSVYGFESLGKYFGCGLDGAVSKNISGYSHVFIRNIYISRIQKHFHCGHNISTDSMLLMTLRAINGLSVRSLTEDEQEIAAKAIEQGYLLRKGNTLYTKILVNNSKDSERLYSVTAKLENGYFDEAAESIAKEMAALIKAALPDYLIGEWFFANRLAGLPMVDALVEALIERGILTPPKDGIGAEGCWMEVEK
ncbi:MAG: sigma-70 family RNA polymerase sigma factor [Clostridia bacterium]|nr:sigma-70 family RNA polymerase sigma factor [Clostridia bacterium]